MPHEDRPVWFITGCSTGFGHEIARHVLERGCRAVVTARNSTQVESLVSDHRGRAVALPLDVTVPDQISDAMNAAEETFGRIDVLVNNAGIGYFGAIEESSDDATKFAVEGLSEALALEVAPLGIKVILVEPSGFRTDWAGRSASEARHTIEDYSATAGKRRIQIRAGSGKQPGDPRRAAASIVQAVEAPNPPLRLLLGKVALTAGREKIKSLARDFEAWAAVTEGADFPEG